MLFTYASHCAGRSASLVNVRAWLSAPVAFDECNLVANRFLDGICCGRQGVTIEIPVVADSLLERGAGGPTSLNRESTSMLWNRRDFAKLGAMGLAARYATMMDAEAPPKKTGYAVIGLGRIAGHFMPGPLDHEFADHRPGERPS